MRRRSFLKVVCGAIAAAFVPAVSARQTGPVIPAYLTDPDAWCLTINQDDEVSLFSGDLSEAALEDIFIEIQESGRRVSIMPTTITWPTPS